MNINIKLVVHELRLVSQQTLTDFLLNKMFNDKLAADSHNIEELYSTKEYIQYFCLIFRCNGTVTSASLLEPPSDDLKPVTVQ